ncbi:glycoside hydrolase [Dichotomocladium elegans]|nr:glycoside hydrolase [Dichotomocladium elegans]
MGILLRWRSLLIAFLVAALLCHIFFASTNIQHPAWEDDSPGYTITDENDTLATANGLPRRLKGSPTLQTRLRQIQFTFQSPDQQTEIEKQRQDAVKKAFLHAWNGYKTYALGHDELRPVSNTSRDPFGGWSTTLVDSLSTLLVMELDDEFKFAIRHLPSNFVVDKFVSIFESTIRHLAGLLSAYELSGRKYDVLLRKAEELGKTILLPALENPAGYTSHFWNPKRKKSEDPTTLLAEIGTIQLEFFMLSHYTSNPIYAKKAQAMTDALDKMDSSHGLNIPGLYPTKLTTTKGGHFMDAVCTFGAMGDSAFEYFLKEYILTEGTINQYGNMYIRSIDNMKKHMLVQIPNSNMLFLPPFDTRTQRHYTSMDALTCFVPGMLAMGAKLFERPDDLVVAKGLLETCVYMARSSTTGLPSETWLLPMEFKPYNAFTYQETLSLLESQEVHGINATSSTKQGIGEHVEVYNLPPPKFPHPEGLIARDRRYQLRPETIESLFILYRITGDPKYQEYGWEIFQAIEKYCKTYSGYAAVRNVYLGEKAAGGIAGNQIDSMESFLLAETFKYLYLLFSPPGSMSLDKFVFNTEAHPFERQVIEWSAVLRGWPYK